MKKMMMPTRRNLIATLLLSMVVLLIGGACSKPEPPKIVPKEARVTAIGPAGLEVLLKVEATNPNSITLSAQSFTGKAKLDGKYEMGTVTVDKPVTLPPNTPTMIDVPMTIPWTDAKVLASLVSVQRPVPYVVDGSVKVGGERLQVDVPFTLSGSITRDQMVGAAVKSLPVIPGLGARPQ
jgi:LEA14-like dessication related protein